MGDESLRSAAHHVVLSCGRGGASRDRKRRDRYTEKRQLKLPARPRLARLKRFSGWWDGNVFRK